MPANNHEVRTRLEQTARQSNHGVILRNQVLAAGMTRAQVDRRVRQRQWIPGPARGTLILASHADNPLAQLAAATIGHNAIAWGQSALALWELGKHPSKPVIVSARRPESSRIAAHHVAGLDELPQTRRHGIATMALEISLASAAGILTRAEMDEAVDEALRRRMTTWGRVENALDQYSRRGRTGSTTAKQLIAERSLDSAIPLSQWSRDFANKVMKAGLPRPKMEWRVEAESGRLLAQVDLAYPECRYAIELDSLAYHLNAGSFEIDRRRDADLGRLGWTVSRFTWKQFVDEWDWVVSIVASQLGWRSS